MVTSILFQGLRAYIKALFPHIASVTRVASIHTATLQRDRNIPPPRRTEYRERGKRQEREFSTRSTLGSCLGLLVLSL